MRRSLSTFPALSIGRSSSTFLSSFSTSSSGGDGRGRGRGLPSDFSLLGGAVNPSNNQNTPDPDPILPPRGRGRGTLTPPTNPIIFTKDDENENNNESQKPNLPAGILSVLTGSGRGKPIHNPKSVISVTESVSVNVNDEDKKPKQEQENRHIRKKAVVNSVNVAPKGEKLSKEDAIKKAVGILSKNDDGGVERGGGGRGRGRGRGGRGGRGRGRGRGERFVEEDDEDEGDYMGNEVEDKANEEKLAKRLGPEGMNTVVEAFEEIADRVLPSPADDAYLNAMHTNLMIECEPEYMMGEFDQNPDIDEKPPIALRDFLEKVKPFIMSYEGIQSQEEWEEAMKETMDNVPLMKEIVDYYSGPDRVTAKTQNEELERVAKTLPATAPSSVKTFTDRAVRTLQSNPGWGFQKKCQFMDKLVWEVSQQYK